MRKMTVMRWRNQKRNRRCLYCMRYIPNSGGICSSNAYGKCVGKLIEVNGLDKAHRCQLFELDRKEEEQGG